MKPVFLSQHIIHIQGTGAGDFIILVEPCRELKGILHVFASL